MKKFSALLLAAIILLSLAACGNSNSQTPPSAGDNASTPPASNSGDTSRPAPGTDSVTLTWGSWVFAEETISPIYQEMADLYNETNTYNTTISTDYYYSYADYLSTLLVDVAGGNGPDVAHVKAEWLPQLMALGVVRSVGDYMSDDVLSDYDPDAISSVTVDGEMMALPWFSNTYALLVNTDLCAQAGVDYTAIHSWGDLMAAAEKISALGSDIYGLAIPNSNGVEAGEGYNTFPVLWAYGGEFENDGKIDLTSEAATSAYTDIQNLFVKSISSPAGSNSFKELRNLFGVGKIGFYWDIEMGISTAASAVEDQDDYYGRTQVITIPNQNSSDGHGYLISHELVVFDSCTDEKMEAMGHFLDFMSGADVLNILYEGGQGKMSSRASVMDQVFANCTQVNQTAGGYTYAYVQAMKSAKPLPSANIHFQDADAYLTNMLTELAQGGEVKGVLDSYQNQIQALYDDG